MWSKDPAWFLLTIGLISIPMQVNASTIPIPNDSSIAHMLKENNIITNPYFEAHVEVVKYQTEPFNLFKRTGRSNSKSQRCQLAHREQAHRQVEVYDLHVSHILICRDVCWAEASQILKIIWI
jgi:hypothetical protein